MVCIDGLRDQCSEEGEGSTAHRRARPKGWAAYFWKMPSPSLHVSALIAPHHGKGTDQLPSVLPLHLFCKKVSYLPKLQHAHSFLYFIKMIFPMGLYTFYSGKSRHKSSSSHFLESF